MVNFSDLGLNAWIVKACDSVGIKNATAVQANCINPILRGRDVLGCAETGSGKTAAFALPILQRLAEDPYGIFALVLTPTRELALQIAEQFRVFGASIRVRVTVVVGGLDMVTQSLSLSKLPHIVVATPGRLLDHLNSNDKLSFKRIKFLVLDEADRLLDKGFANEIGSIMEHIPKKRQTLLFSATMTDSLVALQSISSNKPYVFRLAPVETTVGSLRQEYIFMPAPVKDVYLTYLLRANPDTTCIVFTPTCKVCEFIATLLRELDVDCESLHSYGTQQQRITALGRFKAGAVNVLVATDVASRGLDIPTVNMVINYDVPAIAKDYIHRVGRTARAGRSGLAITLVTQYDVEVLHGIEATIEKKLTARETSEKEVLEGLTEVLSAKRVARQKLVESGFGERQKARKQRAQLQDSDNEIATDVTVKKAKSKR
mmetsp:Transcript_12569/g.20495  ORF Transcript_12569/g.20495 Transcript_12569/m.20495 type:complete len:431 (+) Transcript_12569:2534-3826(+)